MSVVTKPGVLNETAQNFNTMFETFNANVEKQNAYLQAMARNSISQLTGDWAGLDRMVSDGTAKLVYEIGDKFTDTWKDAANSNKEYEFPWRYVHGEDVTLKSGETRKNAMFLQMAYATPYGVTFSHRRAFLRCPSGLAAGTYCVVLGATWGSKDAVKDSVWNFTLTKDVPAGGRLAGFEGMDSEAWSNWKVKSYEAGGKTIIETVAVANGEAGTNLGTMNSSTRNGDLNSMQETARGWNRWASSAQRQWLNSVAGVGSWWTETDEWDIAPDELTTKAGFLNGCSEQFIDAIKEVEVKTYRNNAEGGGALDVTYDKVFLASNEQMYIKNQGAGEGTVFEYWKRRLGTSSPIEWYKATPNLITYAVENHTSAQSVRLRSAHRIYACYTWYVGATGDVDGLSAYYAYRCAPLVVI